MALELYRRRLLNREEEKLKDIRPGIRPRTFKDVQPGLRPNSFKDIRPPEDFEANFDAAMKS